MSIVVTQKSFESNPMVEGINQAVISEVFEKDLPKFGEPGKTERKVIARFVNAQGQDAARFYTPSLHEKSTLVKDLKGIHGSKFVIPTSFDVATLVGQQCQVLVSEKTDSKGRPGAKIESVMKPIAGQNVPLPKKSGAAPSASRQAQVESSLEITDEDIPF